VLIESFDDVALGGMSRVSDLMAELGIAGRRFTVRYFVDMALQIVYSLPRDEFFETV
jgi:hypothetical protein